MANSAKNLFERRKRRNKNKIKANNNENRARISVFRSGKHFYAQLIDDVKGATIASYSTLLFADNKLKTATKDAAYEVGKKLGELIKKVGVKKVVLDRGGYQYHGRVEKFAEGVRESGAIL